MTIQNENIHFVVVTNEELDHVGPLQRESLKETSLNA